MSTGEKRKRFAEGDLGRCQSPAKRRAGSRGPAVQNGAWQDQHRAAIKEVYQKFSSLLKGGNEYVLQSDFKDLLEASAGDI
jgi:hypothetical protein